jgi:hypothetical protein
MHTSEREMALRGAESLDDQMPPSARRGSTISAKRTSELFATALTVDQGTTRLGITSRRLRHRLVDALLSMNARHHHRLPAFQFTAAGDMPGWAQVAPAFQATTPATFMAWFVQALIRICLSTVEHCRRSADWRPAKILVGSLT